MALCVIAAGCSSSTEGAEATRGLEPASATSVPSPTSTSATSTAPSAPPSDSKEPCDGAGTPPSEPRVVVAIDGDGEPDLAAAERRGDAWWLVVAFGAGGTAAIELLDADPFSDVRVLGGVDFLADGNEAVALTLGGGAHTDRIGFVRSRGCELVRLTFEDSSPASFLIGSSVANVSAVLCGTGGSLHPAVEQFSFTIVDGSADVPRYEGDVTSYALEGDRFVAEYGSNTVLTSEELQEIDVFDCDGLAL